MAAFSSDKVRDNYFYVSSLVLSAAIASGAFTVLSMLCNILENFSPIKYVIFLNEVFSAAFIISMVYLSIVFFFWAYTVSKSLISLGAVVQTSPMWSVLWFFIPIFNLFKPYKTMRDFWQKMTVQSVATQNHTMIKIWWAAFIISGVISKVTLQTQLKIYNLASLDFAGMLYIISIITNVLYIIILIKFIRCFSKHFTVFCAFGGVAK